MMTTNKLTKTFAYGSLAIGVLAGSVLTATSASASGSPNGSVSSTWLQWVSGTALVIPGNGATATYKNSSTFAPEEPDKDTVTFFKFGDEFEFIYDATPGNIPVTERHGTIKYEVTFPKFVDGVAMDVDATATYGTVTKTLDGYSPVPFLTSVNGSEDPVLGFKDLIPPTLSLHVTDEILSPVPSGEALSTLSNNFREAPHVPEPGTILGLLAVGGLGMVSRLKRQK
jgi:hypothetical protein